MLWCFHFLPWLVTTFHGSVRSSWHSLVALCNQVLVQLFSTTLTRLSMSKETLHLRCDLRTGVLMQVGRGKVAEQVKLLVIIINTSNKKHLKCNTETREGWSHKTSTQPLYMDLFSIIRIYREICRGFLYLFYVIILPLFLYFLAFCYPYILLHSKVFY